MSDPQNPREPIDVYTVLLVMTEQMASIAWQKLGLQADLATGTVAKDLDQAKVAIDVVAGLAGFLQTKLDDEDQRRIRNLISDLKINFVQQSGGSS